MGIKRHGTWVYRDKRWAALRLQAKRRDDFKCVKCGARGRLEVDHIESVRNCPERAFDLTNLQSLCPACHGAKTRLEVGGVPLTPNRKAWRDFFEKPNRHSQNQQED